jgi:oligopeptide transport system ATP-binding protein
MAESDTTESRSDVILEVKKLKKWFSIRESFFSMEQKYVKAVNGVSFSVKYGETLGVVGESGCGKSTMGRSLMRLIPPTEGEIMFDGVDFMALDDKELRRRRTDMQIIFQDPYASLDPRMTVGELIGEPLNIQKVYQGDKKAHNERLKELMQTVGLDPDFLSRFAHEFSGGQRQRIGIARAMALSPKLIVCDEPVSALDVSIQAQVINLMKEIQQKTNVAYIFISHDLSVVKYVSDRIAVMYLGKIVEIAPRDDLYSRSQHPYTVALLSAIPIPDPTFSRKRIVLEGDIPSPVDLPPGCCFRPRCPRAGAVCAEKEPEFKWIADNHYCACHLV